MKVVKEGDRNGKRRLSRSKLVAIDRTQAGSVAHARRDEASGGKNMGADAKMREERHLALMALTWRVRVGGWPGVAYDAMEMYFW